MRITPLDVRKQEFRKSVRGFDCDEVRAFLETLSSEYEAVLVDNKHLREQFVEQDEKLSEYKTIEKTLRDTLMTAERVMQDTRKNATQEGKLIVKEAELKAQTIMEECRTSTLELRRELTALHQEKNNYLARFEGLASAQIQFIASHKSDFEDVDNRLLELAGSAVPKATKKEITSPDISEVVAAAITEGGGDQWRNYETSTENEATPEIPAVAETEKTTSEVTSTHVNLATLGIPVPSVPKQDLVADEVSAIVSETIKSVEEKTVVI